MHANDELIELVKLKTLLIDATDELSQFTSLQEDIPTLIDQLHDVIGKVGLRILYYRIEK